MRALILEQGHDRAALTAARALAHDGWKVGSGTPVARGLSSGSRAVVRTHRVPTSGAGAAALLAAVNSAIAEGEYEVVFSLDDVGVMGLSQHRDELNAVFPYGDHAGVMRAFDKLELTREAQRAGLAVPRTELAGEAELESFGQSRLVVKPRLTFLDGMDGHLRASLVSGATDARERVQAMHHAGAEPILQEHLEGHLMAFTAITDRDARIVARVQQVADLIWPVGVGVSARAQTVPVDEDLAAGAGRLLESLGWFGLAQLQFILCRDGAVRLLDLNGRFYGSLALAIAAGPNLPAIWARLATGRPVGPVPAARPGVRYQWLAGDLRASCATTSGYTRVGRAVGSVLRAPCSTHSIPRIRDPRPFIIHFSSKLAAWILPS